MIGGNHNVRKHVVFVNVHNKTVLIMLVIVLFINSKDYVHKIGFLMFVNYHVIHVQPEIRVKIV